MPSVAATMTGAADVGEQVAPEDAAVARAERAGGQHVVGTAEDQHLAPHQPRHGGPADDADDDEHDRKRRAHRRGDRDEQQQRREGEGDVGKPHDDGVDPAAVVAGDEAQGDAEERGDGLGDEADAERDAGAVDDPAQESRPWVSVPSR